jgi:hypothetical protein
MTIVKNDNCKKCHVFKIPIRQNVKWTNHKRGKWQAGKMPRCTMPSQQNANLMMKYQNYEMTILTKCQVVIVGKMSQ